MRPAIVALAAALTLAAPAVAATSQAPVHVTLTVTEACIISVPDQARLAKQGEVLTKDGKAVTEPETFLLGCSARGAAARLALASESPGGRAYVATVNF